MYIVSDRLNRCQTQALDDANSERSVTDSCRKNVEIRKKYKYIQRSVHQQTVTLDHSEQELQASKHVSCDNSSRQQALTAVHCRSNYTAVLYDNSSEP